MSQGVVSSDDKLFAGLSYLGNMILAIPTLIIFFLKKDESRHVKFHSLQALFYFAVGFILNIIISVIGGLLGAIDGGILSGIMTMGLTSLVWLVLSGYWIYLMIQAFTGKDYHIPVLGDFIESNLM